MIIGGSHRIIEFPLQLLVDCRLHSFLIQGRRVRISRRHKETIGDFYDHGLSGMQGAGIKGHGHCRHRAENYDGGRKY
ncbi:hypothetical protein CU100_03485 [Phyllobacterium endophyticum]|uniref:Uncharacterized protein n=1 Tax=Phyllobacterium endophyticum TaxID=1149773 RepID=A0A2P7B044_9HYPH|nr:hypothetical protein CU100_03485 [Phyllobacterium endophyticum]